MQLFKFPQWRHFIHFYPIAGKDRTVQPVEFSTAVAFSITSASTSRAPKSELRDPQQQKWDPELGELPTFRPQGPSRLQVFRGAELRFVFVSWTIFCICRGKRKRHTPCLPQQKVEKLWPKKVGDLQSRGTGGQHAIFLGRVFEMSQVMLKKIWFFQSQIFTDLAPEANAELPSEVPTPLPAPVHPAGLPVGSSPPSCFVGVACCFRPQN